MRAEAQRNGGRAFSAAVALVVACLLFFAVVMLRSSSPPPFGDYAEWTYHGALLRDVLRGHAAPAYWLKNYPVPNSTTTAALGLLMLVLPWQVAAKLWLVCVAALDVFAAWVLMRAAGRPAAWQMLLLLPAMALGGALWFGFINFLLGTACAMLVCAGLLRGAPARWQGLLLVVNFFCHMVPFGFALTATLLYAVQVRRWRVALPAVPSLALTLWYFAGRVLHHGADAYGGMGSAVPYGSGLFAAFKMNTYLKCWGFVNPATSETNSLLLRVTGLPVFLALLLAVVVVGAVLLWLLVRSALAAWGGAKPHRFLWTTIALFTGIALFLPGQAAGISDPGGRMMQVALWTAACLLAPEGRWVRRTLAGCAMCLLCADMLLVASLAGRPPLEGATDPRLPARVLAFGHVYYADRWGYYEDIDHGLWIRSIYPTALFLRH